MWSYICFLLLYLLTHCVLGGGGTSPLLWVSCVEHFHSSLYFHFDILLSYMVCLGHNFLFLLHLHFLLGLKARFGIAFAFGY